MDAAPPLPVVCSPGPRSYSKRKRPPVPAPSPLAGPHMPDSDGDDDAGGVSDADSPRRGSKRLLMEVRRRLPGPRRTPRCPAQAPRQQAAAPCHSLLHASTRSACHCVATVVPVQRGGPVVAGFRPLTSAGVRHTRAPRAAGHGQWAELHAQPRRRVPGAQGRHAPPQQSQQRPQRGGADGVGGPWLRLPQRALGTADARRGWEAAALGQPTRPLAPAPAAPRRHGRLLNAAQPRARWRRAGSSSGGGRPLV